jgi:hypothetical protein
MFLSVRSSEKNQVHHINLDHVIEVIEDSGGLLVRLSASSFTEGQSRPSSFPIKDEESKSALLKALKEYKVWVEKV